jgi:hypothetical protein
MTMKLTNLALAIVTAVWMLVYDAEAGQRTDPRASALIDQYGFKRLLDEGRILSAESTHWGRIEGDFIDSHGATNAYAMRNVDPSPFLIDALKAHGIKIEYKAVPREDHTWDWWTDPTFLIFVGMFIVAIVLQLLTLRAVRRLLKTNS